MNNLYAGSSAQGLMCVMGNTFLLTKTLTSIQNTDGIGYIFSKDIHTYIGYSKV